MKLTFFKNKRILVTGHTGFKGSWITEMLLDAGAVVTGYSVDLPTERNLFTEIGLHERMGARDIRGDVRDLSHMEEVFREAEPELVLHLAAQPIVRASYDEPVYTYETNVMGTVNLLECVRKTPSVKSVLNVTTDKVYENFEWERGYREEDRLDGFDPYSNSKSCSELVTHSYKKSFLDASGVAVSTARAGNVIGGGDYAKDRIIPDCIRAAEKGETIIVRNPYSTRPYQHVLEPLSVYLLILETQYEHPDLAGYFNVGPDDVDCLNTGHIADLFCKHWGEGAAWKNRFMGGPHEASFLKLDNGKIKRVFGWEPVWNVDEAVRRTVEYAKADDPVSCMKKQIEEFLKEMKHV